MYYMYILFEISWQLQTQNVKNRILSDSLLGNKLYQSVKQFESRSEPTFCPSVKCKFQK